MKKILLGMIIGLLIITIPVYSEELHQYSAKIEILEDNTVHYNVNLIFSNYTLRTFSLSLENPKDLLITTSIDCTAQETLFGTDILCNVNETDFNIMLEYEYIDKIRENTYFTYIDSLKMPLFTKELIVEVRLPGGTGLMNTTDGLSFTPKLSGAFRSDGRNHYISWRRVSLSKDAVFDFSAAYEKLIVDYSMLFVPIVLLIAIIMALMFYRFYMKEGKMKLVLPVLKDDERKVVEAMMKHGTGVNQKAVVRESGYSKAKVSKVLNSLQERGLIKLERLGRSNKIYFIGKLKKEK